MPFVVEILVAVIAAVGIVGAQAVGHRKRTRELGTPSNGRTLAETIERTARVVDRNASGVERVSNQVARIDNRVELLDQKLENVNSRLSHIEGEKQ